MAKEGKSAITKKTIENISFGSGTIHKNLKYTEGTGWNFLESLMGATSGGSKFNVVAELLHLDVDGALVKVRGMEKKIGETATMEINFIELTPETIKLAVFGENGVSEDANYDVIVSKADIEEGDYLDNIAYVGTKLDGTNIIVILPNALCTSGLSSEGKNKEANVIPLTFEAHADIESDHDKLDYKIYTPKANA